MFHFIMQIIPGICIQSRGIKQTGSFGVKEGREEVFLVLDLNSKVLTNGKQIFYYL